MTFGPIFRASVLTTASVLALTPAAGSAAALTAAPSIAALPPSARLKADINFLQFGIGLDYSEGRYGDISATKVTSVPLSVKYARRNWTFRLSMPIVHVSGPGGLFTTTEGRSDGSGRASTSSFPDSVADSSSASGSAGGSIGSSGSGSASGSSGSSGSSSGGSGTSGSSGGSGSSGSGSSGGSGSSSGSGSGGSGSGSSGSSGGSGSGGTGAVGGTGGSSAGGSAGSTGSNGIIGGGNVLPGQQRSTTGIGDVVAAATYTIDFADAGLFVDLTGKVKIPTASTAKRLGTGKVDLIAAATVTKEIGIVSIFGEGRHRFTGRSSSFALRDSWGASTGVSARLSPRLNLGVDYDWQQSSFAGVGSSSEVTASATYRLNRSTRVQLYTSAGLNRNSVGHSGGIALMWRFDQR